MDNKIKDYIYIYIVYIFYTRITQEETIQFSVDRENSTNFSELWDVPFLGKSKINLCVYTYE